jgi:branched-subunit amino acid aminotransferase/4-amino-4-deoxychorismate lyase
MSTATVIVASTFLTPDQVCEMIPGITKASLAQLRFKGIGPKFYKPTPRVVLYDRESILAWVQGSARTSTAQGA